MNDYISRQEALNKLSGLRRYVLPNVLLGIQLQFESNVREMLERLPAADVVEVVRCKDCRFAHLTYQGDCKQCDKVLDDDDFHITVYYDGDHYCGFGERREDEVNRCRRAVRNFQR